MDWYLSTAHERSFNKMDWTFLKTFTNLAFYLYLRGMDVLLCYHLNYELKKLFSLISVRRKYCYFMHPLWSVYGNLLNSSSVSTHFITAVWKTVKQSDIKIYDWQTSKSSSLRFFFFQKSKDRQFYCPGTSLAQLQLYKHNLSPWCIPHCITAGIFWKRQLLCLDTQICLPF